MLMHNKAQLFSMLWKDFIYHKFHIACVVGAQIAMDINILMLLYLQWAYLYLLITIWTKLTAFQVC